MLTQPRTASARCHNNILLRQLLKIGDPFFFPPILGYGPKQIHVLVIHDDSSLPSGIEEHLVAFRDLLLFYLVGVISEHDDLVVERGPVAIFVEKFFLDSLPARA